VYTLDPPVLSGDTSDQFLFESRRGFCEHFASSFVLLMRAAGLPARVVTGYQGGEFNPIDEYLIVRQSDAHAWAEVWLEGTGWTRVDPTAAVSPDRIELGVHAAVGASRRLPLMARRDFPMFHRMALAWDALNNRWNEWVIGYGAVSQRDLLTALGVGPLGYRGAVAVLVAALPVAGLLVWLAGTLRFRRGQGPDATSRAYEVFCKRLSRVGIVRAHSEAPTAFADRASAGRPDLASEIRRITRIYTKLRYGKEASGELSAALRSAVRAFRPARRPRSPRIRSRNLTEAKSVGACETRNESTPGRAKSE
jgi:hypothetical protein